MKLKVFLWSLAGILVILLTFWVGASFFGGSNQDEVAALRSEIAALKAPKTAEAPPVTTGSPPPTTVAPAPTAPPAAFNPAAPDSRFLPHPVPGVESGNPDGSISMQASPDAGILIPRPASPSYTKEQLVAAARKQGFDALCLANQGTNLDSYELVDWPAGDGKTLLKVLKSPNVAAIRHKDTPPGGGLRPGASSQTQPRRIPPPRPVTSA